MTKFNPHTVTVLASASVGPKSVRLYRSDDGRYYLHSSTEGETREIQKAEAEAWYNNPNTDSVCPVCGMKIPAGQGNLGVDGNEYCRKYRCNRVARGLPKYKIQR